jgi:hypothetical protein
MVSNLAFLEKEHFCLICHKEVNMMKVKNIVNAYLHGFRLPVKADDPVPLGDYDNDIEIACSFQCYAKYLNID